MSNGVLPEVFSAAELARAALVEPAVVQGLIASGRVLLLPGTQYVAAAEALRTGRELREGMLRAPAAAPAELFSGAAADSASWTEGARIRLVIATAYVLVVAVLATWLEPGGAPPSIDEPVNGARLVFVMTPGPGGGGGGGGLRDPRPVARAREQAQPPGQLSIPAVLPDAVPVSATREASPPPEIGTRVEVEVTEPLPSRVLVAPVVSSAADRDRQEGEIDSTNAAADSQGGGRGGGAGTGHGAGNGDGTGSGIATGMGGGTGGGPFRAGSGIAPPRLLREVKADYTDEARRRGIRGDVVLEIVVRRDGSVGDVTVLNALGFGLDERAVTAVRQWRFEPAQRQGSAVDVIVEVAVEFSLR